MKKSFLISVALVSVMSLSFVSCKDDSVKKETLETPKGKYSYAIGYDMGRGLKQIEVELDIPMILQGLRDQLDTTRAALMNDSEVMVAMQELIAEMQRTRLVKDSVKAAENLISQNAFLEKNKSEVGVVSTESGLQFMLLSEGSGNTAKDGDTVSVHYTGFLLDGNKFDSSLDRQQPLTIVLGEGMLIPGWIEMLRLMKKGDKTRVWVPSSLGYGERGSPPVIPGNSMLVFEMELLDIKEK
ncbi:MAG: FKBP-type peptidyl-prolyl cis-trans isomerase [Fibromonadaceae bacterium]|jgi:FKBP-type peptidyl-prolyl cis-trans isomerase|nr:FKBP-type peptidyl-prolyl cis-trans isomerase [Fibromonadaceae bacterium]